MDKLILVIHLMAAAAMIAVILLQRSEGGALGIGGGGGGGFMTGRSAANLLTKITTGLAALFFLTSISLAVISAKSGPNTAGSVQDLLANQPAKSTTPAAKNEKANTPKPAEKTDKKPAAPSAPISQ